MPNCGYNVTGDSGKIVFDGQEMTEDPDEQEMIWCQWLITAPEESVVKLDIKRFEVRTVSCSLSITAFVWINLDSSGLRNLYV